MHSSSHLLPAWVVFLIEMETICCSVSGTYSATKSIKECNDSFLISAEVPLQRLTYVPGSRPSFKAKCIAINASTTKAANVGILNMTIPPFTAMVVRFVAFAKK